ncbi:MAG: zinc-dependent metalloprotease [Chitinophagaceae bacterium]|nr:zinc-dependent metalloprotease [Chitinophagaceae bacterium]MCW5926978.1 zinc-dependent metalloprotease [Chitinophagaceae bacterium]
MRNCFFPVVAFLLLSVVFATSSTAQSICSFDEKYDRFTENPLFAEQVAAMNEQVRTLIANRRALPSKKTTAALYTIPVVVHVMHTGGAPGTIYNPSDAQVTGAINYLNQVFAGAWPGMIPQHEATTITDIQVQFELAKRTPVCGSTNGINRVNASSLPNYTANGINSASSSGVPETGLKNFSRWNPAEYYNIWVVNKIDGKDGTSGQFVGGFAYLPGFPPELDGIVMLATQLTAGNKVLPHEMGHALGLHHTFRGSANKDQCPANNSCTVDGDMVCDTDPVSNNATAAGVYDFTCRTGLNTCTPMPHNNYTENTEQNFMAYTNCSDLFTEGQKERMLAMMSLPSRASLVAPGNMALTPCDEPGVNFSLSEAGVQESVAGMVEGCRRFTDYTYYMEVGAGPTQDAMVTLTVSGTATPGLDYELTTNGSFTNPSNIIQFPASSAAPRAFIVRVFDDGNEEEAETIIIDFTVDAGGGNAQKGSHAPTLTLTIGDNDRIMAPFSGLVTLGSIQSFVNNVPFDATLARQRTQFLYRAEELISMGLSAGTIESLALNIISKQSSRSFNNFTIKAGLASVSHLISGGVVSPQQGLTTVYTNAALHTAAGWNTFDFITPLEWDGTGSIVFEICFDNEMTDGSAQRDAIALYSDGSGSTQSNFFYQGGINCATGFSSINYFNSGFKPHIRLGMHTTGTVVETAISDASQWVGVGGSEYFFSENNRLLARVFDADIPLECVAVSLQETGATWQSFSGGQRSAKVFSVSPASNAATAGYSISLYFTNEELGGIDPGTIRLAKTTAPSISEANGSNTILVVPDISSLGDNITVFTASFTGFSSFFLTTSTVTLPVTWLDFNAVVDAGKDVVLHWKTGSEANNAGFEIETSVDGSVFRLLAAMASKGNTGTGHDYSYKHIQPGAGIHYYRIRQTDFDGKNSYSDVVSVKIDATSRILLAPVPAKESATLYLNRVLQAPARLLVFSAGSRQVYQAVLPPGTDRHNIPLSNLQAGVYYVQVITTDQRPVVLRLIKE